MNQTPWNRKILTGYWTVVLLYLLAGLAGLVLTLVQYAWWVDYYLFHQLLLPLLLMSAEVGALELAFRKRKGSMEPWFILTATTLAATIVLFNPNLHGMYALFALSTLTSLMYFDRKLTLFSCLLGIVTLLLLQLDPAIHASMTLYELIAMIATLSGAYLLGLGVISRGEQILNQLTKAMESERDLLVDNIMYDTMTKTDALTGLYNHKTFHEYLDSLLNVEAEQLSLQVAVLDIDNFKSINDTYGHWVGDLVLKRIALMIREYVTPNDFVARYGGEEFALILTDADSKQAFRTLDFIREKISQVPHDELAGRSVTVSIGFAERVPDMRKENLFKIADARLYEAKRTGKNKVVGTSPSTQEVLE
ncbi:GGDEF domain-containing protein [Tumebacillus sp. ITR2]|uniref:GGDEF domain-containing protein n=1 Tax=Tumebacillus amylolyticus TaxID=2801339 RepID=A0ABS1JAZ8_9BACL|nr:GGDEF domain-containing protein [Tumebacillus amylolyticus]MBL0387434.1 GGDEF domain-containing protein [Tumebacillus amylolyticus]